MPIPRPKFLTSSRVLAQIPHLATFVEGDVTYCGRWQFGASGDGVLAWGRKPSAVAAEQLAVKMQLPLLRLEDGFLRSVDLGIRSAPYSVVLDDIGIYYDATTASRLEQLIIKPLEPSDQARAEALCQLWQNARVSKYNHSREELSVKAPWFQQPFVLVVDQTFQDASIRFGLADPDSFQQMLAAALAFDPLMPVVVKIHPDVLAGKKQGHFSHDELTQPRVIVVSEDIHAPALLEKAQAVFCVTSQMGFEALLWQKPVFTFGMPFYAGWGLTHDALAAPARRSSVSLAQLVFAALVRYPRYIHPETTLRCEVEELLLWMAMQRQARQRLPAKLVAIKPSRWKRSIFRQFTQGSCLRFARHLNELQPDEWLIQWGSRATHQSTVRVEDGFIRSVGLGADLTKPCSWVFDPIGMYYDATAPSTLEHLLQHADFSATERARAKALRQLLLDNQVTKYNVGKQDWQRPRASTQTVILVPGQVESDASIQLGSPVLKTNLDLLTAVRQAQPDAYIVYKPHPDVLAGLRKAGAADQHPSSLYDELICDQDMAWMLAQVDEVHTLTSLSGFEALLRGKPVHCYGQPFYAGWGLTQDVFPHPRRTRQRTLDELIAATLIRYPTYISPKTGYYTTPEQVIHELTRTRQQRQPSSWASGLARGMLRKLLALKRF